MAVVPLHSRSNSTNRLATQKNHSKKMSWLFSIWKQCHCTFTPLYGSWAGPGTGPWPVPVPCPEPKLDSTKKRSQKYCLWLFLKFHLELAPLQFRTLCKKTGQDLSLGLDLDLDQDHDHDLDMKLDLDQGWSDSSPQCWTTHA